MKLKFINWLLNFVFALIDVVQLVFVCELTQKVTRAVCGSPKFNQLLQYCIPGTLLFKVMKAMFPQTH